MPQKKLLEEILYTETLKSEKLRATILGSLLLFALFAFGMINIFFTATFEKYMTDTTPFYWMMLILAFLVVREYFARKIVDRAIRTGKKFPDFIRYGNLILEISIISVILIILLVYEFQVYILSSPAVYLYFVFITLSTLSLDLKVSVSAGATAAIQYFLIAFITLEYTDNKPDNFFSGELIVYGAKSLIILVSGVVAGLVANQLNKRIYRTQKSMQERNEIINMFGQQISSKIVEYLVANNGNIKSEKKFACIMFLDIRGFTPFAEKRTPEEIVQYQNDVFSFMIEIVNKNNGIINQILGDGFMATFGVPLTNGNPCAEAVRAAMEIQEKVEEFSQAGKISPTKIGIGLHAGDVVAGNVGTVTRLQYSITGNPVIIAARLEQLNKVYKSSVLVSKEVYEKAFTDIEYENLGPVQVKGRSEPVEIFRLA